MGTEKERLSYIVVVEDSNRHHAYMYEGKSFFLATYIFNAHVTEISAQEMNLRIHIVEVSDVGYTGEGGSVRTEKIIKTYPETQ